MSSSTNSFILKKPFLKYELSKSHKKNVT